MNKKKAAEKIIASIVERENDDKVRQVMSESIKNSEDIPHGIVMSLAEDVTIVAVPILEFSNVLTDENLVYIIQTANDVEKEKSISRRTNVSSIVSDALINNKREPVVVTLLRNKTSHVSDSGYENILKSFSSNKSIMEEVTQRPKVPLYIVRDATERMYPSNQNVELEQNVDCGFNDFLKAAKEKNVPEEIMAIYALCRGSLKFFEYSVARAMCIPFVNVEKLIKADENGEKFDIIYQRANLPEGLHNASKALFLVLRDFSDDINNNELTSSEAQRVINNLIMLSDEMGISENVDYLISLINFGINR